MNRFALIVAGAALAGTASSAAAEIITLDFNSLPSAQGWTYIADGDGASVPESGVFSVSGGQLNQNSLGIGMTVGGGNLYQRSVTLAPTQNWSMTLVARVNAFESVLAPAYPFGLYLGGGNGLAVGFGSDNIQVLGDMGIALYSLPGGFDSGAFNSYRLSVTGGGLQSFSINGTSVFSNIAFLGGNPTFIGFGDGTGFANVNADIRALEFNSGAVPEPASWALMIAGFGLVGSAMRRHAAVRLATA
jgi:PEP-CTERM motif